MYAPKMRRLLLAFAVLSVTTVPAFAAVRQASGPYEVPAGANDSAAITVTVQRYALAWYEGNAEQLQQTLHPDFVWRSIVATSDKPAVLVQQSGLSRLDSADRGGARSVSPSKRKAEVSVLTIDRNLASVRLIASDRAELLHLARWNNIWRILDAVSEPGGAP